LDIAQVGITKWTRKNSNSRKPQTGKKELWDKKSAFWSTSGDMVRLHSRLLLTYSFVLLFCESNKVAPFDSYTIIQTAYRI
jgi:hypothetical protein